MLCWGDWCCSLRPISTCLLALDGSTVRLTPFIPQQHDRLLNLVQQPSLVRPREAERLESQCIALNLRGRVRNRVRGLLPACSPTCVLFFFTSSLLWAHVAQLWFQHVWVSNFSPDALREAGRGVLRLLRRICVGHSIGILSRRFHVLTIQGLMYALNRGEENT